MKKRILTILICVALVAAFTVACADDQDTPAPPLDANGITVPPDETDPEPDPGDVYTPGPRARYTDEVVITIAKAIPALPNLPPGDTPIDNDLTRYLHEVLNVRFEMLWEVPEDTYMERLALALVSGDLPDIFDFNEHNFLFFRQLVDNDMLTDLIPYYDTFLGETVKSLAGFDGAYEGGNLEPLMDDGRLLAFAGTRYGWDGHNLLWMRQDWLDDAGLDQPTTLADLENVLTTWRDDPPVDDYISLILLPSTLSANVLGTPSPIFAYFNAYPGLWIRNANGEVINGSVAPETRDGLEFLARWYEEGLIDRQFAARDGDEFYPMFTAGLTGAVFSPWWTPYAIGDFPHMNPDGEIAVLNAPVDPAGRFNIIFPNPTGHLVMVRNGFEHPEALFKIMNVTYEAWLGVDEVGFEMFQPIVEAGASVGYTFPTGWFNVARPDTVPHSGLLARTYIHTGSFGDLYIPSEFTRGTALGASRFYHEGSLEGTDWIEFHARYLAAYITNAPEVSIVRPAFSLVTDSSAIFGASLDALVNTTFLQIVMGDLPIEAFDDFVVQWYASGGQVLTDEIRALVDGR